MKEYIERTTILNLLGKINSVDFGSMFDYEAHGASKVRNITANCNGKRKSAYGYIWHWGQRKEADHDKHPSDPV